MKSKFSFNFTFVLLLFAVNTLFAQSDYETVQNFKNEVRSIEQAIRGADSLGTLDEVSQRIDQLNSKYAANKQLLDNSLYPDNMDQTIQRLKNQNNLRRGDFAQITELKTNVTELKTQVDTLTAKNNELAQQFAQLESTSNAKIAQLQKIVSQLRVSLQKRDQVVMNMIGDLLPSNYKEGENLSSQEKQQIVSQAEKNNVLYNIKKAVNDNIRFLDATHLYPEDLRKVKNQQENFTRIWKTAGPTMAELYAEKGKSTSEFNEIDEAFATWNTKINEEAWSSINTEFAQHNINLRQFSNGDDFTSTITGYISDEIANADAKGSKEAEAKYNNFVDSTWDKRIRPSWLPYLLDNRMLTENQVDSMDVKMAAWRDVVYPKHFNWLYVVIAVLAIAVIVLLFTRKPRSNQTPPPVNQRTA